MYLLDFNKIETNPLIKQLITPLQQRTSGSFLMPPSPEITNKDLKVLVQLDFQNFITPCPSVNINFFQFIQLLSYMLGCKIMQCSLDLPIILGSKDNYRVVQWVWAPHHTLMMVEQLQVYNLAELSNMLKDNFFESFDWAVRENQLVLLKYLISQTSNLFPDMLKNCDYDIFMVALEFNYLDVAECLIKHADRLLPNMLQKYCDLAFRKAVLNGDLSIVKLLVTHVPWFFTKTIAKDNYSVFKSTAEDGQLSIINYLLSVSDKDTAQLLYSLLTPEQQNALWKEHLMLSGVSYSLSSCLLPELKDMIFNMSQRLTFFKPVACVKRDDEEAHLISLNS